MTRDLYASISLKHGETRFTVRATDNEGYNTLWEKEYTLEQCEEILTAFGIYDEAAKRVRANRLDKVVRLQSLKESVAKLEAELEQ